MFSSSFYSLRLLLENSDYKYCIRPTWVIPSIGPVFSISSPLLPHNIPMLTSSGTVIKVRPLNSFGVVLAQASCHESILNSYSHPCQPHKKHIPNSLGGRHA